MLEVVIILVLGIKPRPSGLTNTYLPETHTPPTLSVSLGAYFRALVNKQATVHAGTHFLAVHGVSAVLCTRNSSVLESSDCFVPDTLSYS